MAAHRWRYAYVERSADSPIGWDAGAKIGTCGDWHCGPRVELAGQSGADLASHILGHSPAITGIPEQRG